MAEFIKDGFTFFDGFFNDSVFHLDGSEIKKKIEYLRINNIKNISLDISLVEFDFLKDLNFIEEIYISENVEVENLYYLSELKRIVVNVLKSKPKIDYSKFIKLEILSIDWYHDFPDLSKNRNLKELSIWKFKPKSKSLGELKLPEKLEKLHITESNILSLEGLSLKNLREFEGHYCNSLETVRGIKDFGNNLEVLVLDYCRKLTNYDELKFCKELEKIILGNSGDIPSLNWLNYLKEVKHFSFWNTKLIDGDTSPCFGIEYVSFKNRKHYNHKKEEFGNIGNVP